jgi:hypothetical protein
MNHRTLTRAASTAMLMLAGGVLAGPALASDEVPTYGELRELTVAFVDDSLREFVLVSYVDAAEQIDSPRNDRIADAFLGRYVDRVAQWTEPDLPPDASITPAEAAELVALAEALRAA